LLRDFHGHITAWYPSEQLVLPRAPQAGAIILHEVGLMGYEDQLRLLDWLETRLGRTQIISTTSAPLLPKVESGAFNDTLYYRLNTVSVDVSADGLTASSEPLRSRAG
jgi:transcriptional regulator of acetoin/glycerol metabolism